MSEHSPLNIQHSTLNIQTMIQNNQATMQNAPGRRPQQAEDFIRLQDLMYLCLVRWRWFVISLVVTLGIATYYLLSTPGVYQRTASILIKEDGKSQSINSDVASMFSDMGLSGGKSNVNNELIAIQSPAVLLEAGKQLKLDVNYSEDGTFHPVALYGRTLPVTVHFYSLNDMQSASLDVEVKHGNLFSIVHVRGTDKAGNVVESGITSPIAFAAPVELGTMFIAPALARLRSPFL